MSTDGRSYYVSVFDGPGKFALLAGPYASHDEAYSHLEVVRRLADQVDPFAWFYAYGTVAMPADYDKPGRLNLLLERTGAGVALPPCLQTDLFGAAA